MDIRVINKKNETINLTNSDIKRSGKFIIGINEYGITKQVEEFETEKEAEEKLAIFSQIIEEAATDKNKNLLIVNR